MTMMERMQELERRVGHIENERARNITALVEQTVALDGRAVELGRRIDDLDALVYPDEGTPLRERIDALEHEKRVLFHNASVETGIREDIGRRVVALEQWRGDMRDRGLTPYTAYSELHTRMAALEARLPAPIPVDTPLAFPIREPPLALPVRPLSPAPDYRIERECEPERCSCEESEALRADLQTTLDDLNRKIDLLGEARAENERLRAEAQGERDKTARLRNAVRDREAAELAALQELNEQTASLREAEASAMEDGESVLALVVALAEATEENDRLRAELGRSRARLGVVQHEHRLGLGTERNRVAAANALLDAVRNEIDRHDEGDGDSCYPDSEQTIGRIRSMLLAAEAKEATNQNHR